MPMSRVSKTETGNDTTKKMNKTSFFGGSTRGSVELQQGSGGDALPLHTEVL